MADETTDVSNKEQVTLIIRRITENLEVHEEFLGLYIVSSTNAAMLSDVIRDLFVRMNVSLEKLVGSAMMGLFP